jgi:hypothetical protein
LTEEGNNPSDDDKEFWGLDEDLDKGEATEKPSTFDTFPARATGDKVRLIDAIHLNKPKSMFTNFTPILHNKCNYSLNLNVTKVVIKKLLFFPSQK